MNLRFSLRDLLMLVAVICISCAALANTGLWWHSVVVTATLLGMTGLVLWGALHPGQHRAWVCGWLLFAAAYLALVFGPWTGANLGTSLITTKGLGRLELACRGGNSSPQVLEQKSLPIDFDGDGYIDLSYSGRLNANSFPYPLWIDYSSSLGSNGAQSCTTFQSTGHWLLASVFGYLGGLLAIFLWRTRQNPATLPGCNAAAAR